MSIGSGWYEDYVKKTEQDESHEKKVDIASLLLKQKLDDAFALAKLRKEENAAKEREK